MNGFPTRPIQLTLLALSLLLVLDTTSCTRKKPAPKQEAAATELPGPGAPIELPPQIIRTIERENDAPPPQPKASDDGDKDDGVSPPPPPPDTSKQGTGIDMTIPSGGEAARYPRDFGIGPIEDDETAPPEARTAVSAFLVALAKGNVATDSLSPGAVRPVQAVKARILALDPRLARYGSAKLLDDGSISFLVRFIGKEKSASGELILAKVQDAWKIDDLILDEADVPLEKEGVKFDPVDYKQVF